MVIWTAENYLKSAFDADRCRQIKRFVEGGGKVGSYSETLAAHLMKKYPDARDYPGGDWNYAQGFMLWGFIKLYCATGQRQYIDYVLDYCDRQVERDGTITRFTGYGLDDVMPASVLTVAWRQTGENKYRSACEKVRRMLNDYPRNHMGGFWHMRKLPGEMWVDGLFMGLLFLLHYGKCFGDEAYCYSEITKQLTVAGILCQKDNSGLLYHAHSDDLSVEWAHPVTGKSSEVWSEGLGWYALILTEVLQAMSPDIPGYSSIQEQARKLASALKATQDEASGLWCQVVDKANHPRNFFDTSGSAMFSYFLATGLGFGLHNKTDYQLISENAWGGLLTRFVKSEDGDVRIIHACDGLGVQNTYDEYVDYPQVENAKEAVPAFFWAACANEYGVSANLLYSKRH